MSPRADTACRPPVRPAGRAPVAAPGLEPGHPTGSGRRPLSGGAVADGQPAVESDAAAGALYTARGSAAEPGGRARTTAPGGCGPVLCPVQPVARLPARGSVPPRGAGGTEAPGCAGDQSDRG